MRNMVFIPYLRKNTSLLFLYNNFRVSKKNIIKWLWFVIQLGRITNIKRYVSFKVQLNECFREWTIVFTAMGKVADLNPATVLLNSQKPSIQLRKDSQDHDLLSRQQSPRDCLWYLTYLTFDNIRDNNNVCWYKNV